VLTISGLHQLYGQSHILWDIELKLTEGTCTCIMGRNGVGKTTLLRTIVGLVPIRSGRITFGEHSLTEDAGAHPLRSGLSRWLARGPGAATASGPIARSLRAMGAVPPMPPHRRSKLGIGYVPQGREIFAQLTVEENLRIGLAARRDGVTEIPSHIFDMFPVLRTMLHRRGGDLSGGQQQQLAIGRALVPDPKLLILDEPTEGIQPNIVQEIGSILLDLNRSKRITILLVEQKLAFARRVADTFCIMDKGRIVASGAMSDLGSDLVSQYLTV
jgi:urea transport system ATP-binding protein